MLLATGTRTFVPGHGRPVDRAFVVDQQRWLAAQRHRVGARESARVPDPADRNLGP